MVSATPTVSIVVPNYNHGRFLRQRLDTILAQSYQDFELILLDDCSYDDSLSILRKYASDPRVRIDANKANSGSTFKQWNKGVRLARGKYVWVAESDDYADPRLLDKLVAVLDSDPIVTFTYCRSWRVDENNRPDGFGDYYLVDLAPDRWTSDFSISGEEMCREYFAQANAVPNASSVVFRKSVYREIGGADETLRLCGDWKLWASMALKGRVAYLSEPMNYFRHHSASVRARAESSNERDVEFLRLFRWMTGQVTVPERVREAICEREVSQWVGMMLSFRTPFALKQSVARDVWALDPRPVRRAVRPALTALRLKTLRHWRDVQLIFVAANPQRQRPKASKDA